MWYPRAPRNPTLVHTLWKLKAKVYSGLSLPEGHDGAHRRTTDCSVWCFAILCVGSGTQSCLTLCTPMDCRPPGSSVHDVFQARLLEWLAIFSSRVSSWPRDQTQSPASPARSGGFFAIESCNSKVTSSLRPFLPTGFSKGQDTEDFSSRFTTGSQAEDPWRSTELNKKIDLV